jgi:hypothetical protein
MPAFFFDGVVPALMLHFYAHTVHHAFIKQIQRLAERHCSLPVVGAGSAYGRRSSMAHRLMITVATAALIAGTSFANAQGMGGGREGGATGGGMQQSAPSSSGGAVSSPSGGAASHEGSAGGMKASESDQKGSATNRSAQQDMKSGGGSDKSMGEKSAQDTKGGDHSKSISSQNDGKGTSKGMKAEGQERNGNVKAEGRDDHNRGDHNNADRAEGRDNNANGMKENRTVGQAGASAKLSTEQRTKITTVIRDQHVSPVTNVNFSISVGTRVPREVGFHPLPTDIVTIYPDWRGYEFFLVRDQIVVVDPRSLEIVAVLDA